MAGSSPATTSVNGAPELKNYLLKFSSLERRYIASGELKPFTVCRAFFREAAMPISFNPWRVIGSDRMNQTSAIGQSCANLLHSLFKLIATTNFVVRAPLDQVNKAIN